MEKRGFLLAGLLVLIGCSISSANVTNINYASDGDGVFNCNPWQWTGNLPEVTLPTIYGDYVDPTGVGAPGHLILNVLADSADDPTLKINNSIENDSSFAWTKFTVNLTMAVGFTLTNVTVTAPGDWTVISFDQTAINTGSNFLATVVYDTGTAIPNDALSTIDFGYWVKFVGSPSYTITQEMIPVPEPSTFVLLASGLLMAGFVFAKKR